MDASDRQQSRRAVVLVAAVYLVAGLAFGALAGMAGSGPMRTFWRLMAWAISALAFVAHIGYEHLRVRHDAFIAALHVAVAVALGAFGLALAANVHAWQSGSGNRALLAISLVAWPVLTAIPAFVVAAAASAALMLARRR
jgi:hypothetical protein